MSFHPNDIARRAGISKVALCIGFVLLVFAFFRTQVLDNQKYVMQSEENRLRPIPLPAPRGIIYDRKGLIIAENLPGYSVSITAQNVDSLRASLARLASTLQLSNDQVEAAVRRFRRAPTRPTVVLADASIDVISVLEEHRLDYPRLIIQSVPKRYYPDAEAVASFVGYTGEITESELNAPQYEGYKPGQQVGKGGLEKQYEKQLRGREGVRFDEVDARGRPVRGEGPRPDLLPEGAPPLYTNIDLDLQRYAVAVFGDSLQGGVVALDPNTGEVLALYSAPSFDPNKFTGGIPAEYYKQLLTDERRPLVNKAVQGRYPPGSTFKLATAVTGLTDGVVGLNDHMPVPCTGGYQYGSRYFRCWEKKGHGAPLALRRDQALVRRLLLPARPEDRTGEDDRRRNQSRLPRKVGNRSPRGESRPLAVRGEILQREIREELEQRRDAESRHRAGREFTDGREHGEVLHSARHRRPRRDA